MKKTAFILGVAMVLSTTSFAQTAEDVKQTDTLNQEVEIKVVETEVKTSEVGANETHVEETAIINDIEPNADAE